MLNNYKIITCVLLCFILSSVTKAQILKICTQEENLKHNATTEWGTMFSHSKNRTIEQLVDYPMGLLFLPKNAQGLLYNEGGEIINALIKKHYGFEAFTDVDAMLTLDVWYLAIFDDPDYKEYHIENIPIIFLDGYPVDDARFGLSKTLESADWDYFLKFSKKEYSEDNINILLTKWINKMKGLGFVPEENYYKSDYYKFNYDLRKGNKKVDFAYSADGTSYSVVIGVNYDIYSTYAYEQIKKLYIDGNTEDCLKKIDEFLKRYDYSKHPHENTLDVYLLKGQIYWEEKKYSLAEGIFEEIVRKYPDEKKVITLSGDCAWKKAIDSGLKTDYDHAIWLFKKLEDKYPNKPEYWGQTLYILYSQNNNNQSRDKYAKYWRLGNTNPKWVGPSSPKFFKAN